MIFIKKTAVFFCLTLLLSNFGCAQNAETASGETLPSDTSEVATPTNNNRYYVSTARQSAEINPDFPFDIKLRMLDSTFVSSAKKFAKNGKPTVLAFWLTTCYPCRIELQDYAKKFEAWQKDTPFNLYAVSIDFPDREEKVKEYTKSQDWPFEFVWDIDREFKQVLPGGLNGLPQVFLYDAAGKLVFQHRKYRLGDDDALFEEVKKAATQK